MNKGIVLLEVNEVPFTIWDRYITKHPKSATAKLFARSHQLETVTPDVGYESIRGAGSPHSEHGHLTPWTTWPTVHRGVSNSEHRILDIGQDLQDINKNYPAVWQILADAGHSVGVFGSLHSYPAPAHAGSYDFYVPDPFAATTETIPAAASSFQEFSVGATRASGRNVGGLDKSAALRFVKDAPGLGLRPKTAAKLAKQLVTERVNKAAISRRRVFQSILGFDLYLKMLKETKPEFSTFFANHVAAAMHRYWAAAYPTDYQQLAVSDEWSQSYEDEIDFAMGAIDSMIEDLTAFCEANPGHRLVIASSMGQAPTVAKTVETELAITDLDLFMKSLGVPSGSWAHAVAMFPNFNVKVEPSYQHQFRSALSTLKVDGEPLDWREAANGFFSLDFGQPNLTEPRIELLGSEVDGLSVGITNMAIADLSLKCADHVAQGSMLVFDPSENKPVQDRRAVSTTDIAPALLALLNCEVPSHMTLNPVPGLVD